MAYEHVRAMAANPALPGTDTAAYTMVDRIGYQPHTIATIGINHPRRGDVEAYITSGPAGAPIWGFGDVFPIGGPQYPFNGYFPVDLSDFTDGTDLDFHLEVRDWFVEPENDPGNLWQPPLTGTVTYFAVAGADSLSRACAEVPANTVEWTVDEHGQPAGIRLSIQALKPAAWPALSGFENGQSQAWGDVDDDGDLDLAVAGLDAGNRPRFRLLLNDGAGGLTDANAPLVPDSGNPSWVDFNRDGRLDLAICSTSSRLYLGQAGGGLVESTLPLPRVEDGTFVWGDVDGDGFPDLAVAGGGLYRNVGGRALAALAVGLPAAGRALRCVQWADLDNDGNLDLVAADTYATLAVWRGDGAGGFAPQVDVAAEGVSRVAAVDVDGDGWLDLAAPGISIDTNGDGHAETPGLLLLWNQGSFQFAAAHRSDIKAIGTRLGPAMDWGDVNRDGRPDLLLSGDWPDEFGAYTLHLETRLLVNRGGGAFAAADIASPARFISVPRLVDMDGDGDLDLAATGFWANRADEWRPVSRPVSPTQLQVEPTTGASGLLFSWATASATATPAPGLAYRVRCGTFPGGGDLVSAATGWLWPPATGRYGFASPRPGLLLPSLPKETIGYAAVQAVDACGLASPWSADVRFDVRGLLPEPPGLPARVGGTVTVNGALLEGSPELVLEALRTDGVSFSPPVVCRRLNAAGCYVLDLPIGVAGAAGEGTEVCLRATLGGADVTVVTPRRGRLRSGLAGTMRRVDVVGFAGPVVVATVPADGATEVTGLQELSVRFSEPVFRGPDGVIGIWQLPDRRLETIPVGSPAVTLSGTTVTIALGVALAPGQLYAVRFDERCFRGAAGVFHPGMPAARNWSFQTLNREFVYAEMAAWGSLGFGLGQFDRVYGIAVGPLSRVYVTERGDFRPQRARVQEFQADGTFVTAWSEYGSAPGLLKVPSGIACDAAGNIYVADTGNQRVQVFTSEGRLLSTWDAAAGFPFQAPHGIAVAPDGTVLVADSVALRVFVLAADGELLATWGAPSAGGVTFTFPRWVAAAPDGRVLVADAAVWGAGGYVPPRIQVLDADGERLGVIGAAGNAPGRYGEVSGLAVGPEGLVYVADGSLGCVHLFSLDGTFLERLTVGGARAAGGLDSVGAGDLPRGDISYGAIAAAGPGAAVLLDPVNGRVRRFRAYSDSADQVFEVAVGRGWELLSAPLAAAARTDESFVERLETGAYVPEIWPWHALLRRLVPAHYVAPLVGFWLSSEEPGTVRFRGPPAFSSEVAFRSGWNLVGPAAVMRVPWDHPLLRMPAWGWDSAAQCYTPVSSGGDLLPGRAYWMLALRPFSMRMDER
jgi:DNA-binding beta-propeller fold protein YncE